MNKRILMCALFISILFITENAFSQIQAIAVAGKVAYKSGRTWKPLMKGQVVRKGTQISTGFRSWAVFRINGKSYLRVKPLSKITVYFNSAKRRQTHIGLKRGGVRAKIHNPYKYKRVTKRKIKTIFRVSTPIATASVRGTEEDITYGPARGMIIRVLNGEILGQSRNGNKRFISNKLTFVKKPGLLNPLPLISRVRNRSIIRIHDPNITVDESTSHNYNGGDVINTTDGSANTFDSNIKNTDRTTLNIYVNWPQK